MPPIAITTMWVTATMDMLLAHSPSASAMSTDHHFEYGETAMTWREADDWCLREYGVHLASIHDHDQNIDVLESCGATTTNGCWIGAHRVGADDDGQSHFEWTDDTNFEYIAWSEGGHALSADTDSDCVYMDGNGTWTATFCEDTFHPICGRESC